MMRIALLPSVDADITLRLARAARILAAYHFSIFAKTYDP